MDVRVNGILNSPATAHASESNWSQWISIVHALSYTVTSSKSDSQCHLWKLFYVHLLKTNEVGMKHIEYFTVLHFLGFMVFSPKKFLHMVDIFGRNIAQHLPEISNNEFCGKLRITAAQNHLLRKRLPPAVSTSAQSGLLYSYAA